MGFFCFICLTGCDIIFTVYFASHFQEFHSIAVWHWSFKGFPKARHNGRYGRKNLEDYPWVYGVLGIILLRFSLINKRCLIGLYKS